MNLDPLNILDPVNLAFEQRYRPRTLEEVVLPDDHVARKLQSYVAGQTRRPLLLYGPYGTGKSTIADLLPHAMVADFQEGDRLRIKADGRKNVAERIAAIERFAPYVAFNAVCLRVVVVDEADNLTKEIQRSLKAHVDHYMRSALFIFTTNRFQELDEGLRSRSTCLYIGPARAERWLPRMKKILRREGGAVPPDVRLLALAQAAKGDVRKLLEDLQDLASLLRPGRAAGQVSREAAIVPFPGGEEPNPAA
jgi:DNA polymerase III delta prime subunit